MKTLLFLLAFCALPAIAAGPITKLTWNAPAVPVAGHKLYEKLPPAVAGGPPVYNLIGTVTGPVTELILPVELTIGPRVFVATAFDSLGQESPYSAEAILPARPGAPVNLRITIEFTP